MKKIFLLIIILMFVVWYCEAQQTYWTPGVPPGSTSFSTSFRFSGTDSLANLYFSNGNKWWQSYTATQQNLRFVKKIDSGKFIQNTTILQPNSGFHIGSMGTFERSALGAGSYTSINLVNNTAATLGLIQGSGSVHWHGSAFATTPAISQPIDFYMSLRPAQEATNSGGQLVVQSSINNSSPFDVFTLSESSGIGVSTIAAHKLTLSTALNASAGYVSAYRSINDLGPTANGDLLVAHDFDATFSNGSPVNTVGSITPGSGYTDGFYPGVTLTDVSTTQVGNAITANVTVFGGSITTVVILTGGARHQVGNILVANNAMIGGGTGFQCQVATLGSYTSFPYQIRVQNAAALFAPSTSTYGSIVIPAGVSYTGTTEGSFSNVSSRLFGLFGGISQKFVFASDTGTSAFPSLYTISHNNWNWYGSNNHYGSETFYNGPTFNNGINMGVGSNINSLGNLALNDGGGNIAVLSYGGGNMGFSDGVALSGFRITADQMYDYHNIPYLKASGTGAGALKDSTFNINKNLKDALNTPAIRTNLGTQRRFITNVDSLAKGDGVTDDHAAIAAVIATRKDIQLTANKRYKMSDFVTMNPGQKINGNGASWVINGTHAINLADSVTIENVRFVGNGKSSFNVNEIAIFIKKHKGVTISKCTFDSLAYTGIYADSTVNFTGSLSPHYKGNTISNCRFYNSRAGLVTGKRGEYIQIESPIAQNCDTAIVNGGGNNPINNPMLVDNGINLYVKNSGANDSHSNVTGGAINHGSNYNVVVDSVQYGVQFTGVVMLASQILIKNSPQVNFDNCWLSSRSAILPFTSTNSNFVVANSTFIGTVLYSESGVHAQHNFYNNRLNYLPGLVTSIQRNTDSLLWCLNPASGMKVDRTIQGVSFNNNTNINVINGAGFVKGSGTTISYDNSTYLSTSVAKFVSVDGNNLNNIANVSSQDLNLLTGTQFGYYTSPTNGPGSNGWCTTAQKDGNVIFQTFFNTSGAEYFRVTTTGSAGWGGWKLILNNGTAVTVAQGGTGVSSSTGTVAVVLSTNPTLITPTIGVATATSINKVAITAPATSATLTIANGKTLTYNNSITVAGTDATTMTFPTTSASIARTDAANTFTGIQSFLSNPILNTTSVANQVWTATNTTGSGNWANAASGTVTNVTSANTDIGITSGTTIPVLTFDRTHFPYSTYISLTPGDYLVYNGSQWVNRPISGTGRLSWNNTTGTMSLNNSSHTIFAPTTGGTVTLVNNQANIINPSGALVALTLALPSSPANNDEVKITFTQAVTTISYSGGTVVGGLTTIAQGGQYYLTYDSGTATWY